MADCQQDNSEGSGIELVFTQVESQFEPTCLPLHAALTQDPACLPHTASQQGDDRKQGTKRARPSSGNARTFDGTPADDLPGTCMNGRSFKDCAERLRMQLKGASLSMAALGKAVLGGGSPGQSTSQPNPRLGSSISTSPQNPAQLSHSQRAPASARDKFQADSGLRVPSDPPQPNERTPQPGGAANTEAPLACQGTAPQSSAQHMSISNAVAQRRPAEQVNGPTAPSSYDLEQDALQKLLVPGKAALRNSKPGSVVILGADARASVTSTHRSKCLKLLCKPSQAADTLKSALPAPKDAAKPSVPAAFAEKQGAALRDRDEQPGSLAEGYNERSRISGDKRLVIEMAQSMIAPCAAASMSYPRRQRQPPPAFLSGPCDMCGTMGSRKWLPGQNGKGCLCTCCHEDQLAKRSCSFQPPRARQEECWRPEDAQDCTTILTKALGLIPGLGLLEAGARMANQRQPLLHIGNRMQRQCRLYSLGFHDQPDNGNSRRQSAARVPPLEPGSRRASSSRSLPSTSARAEGLSGEQPRPAAMPALKEDQHFATELPGSGNYRPLVKKLRSSTQLQSAQAIPPAARLTFDARHSVDSAAAKPALRSIHSRAGYQICGKLEVTAHPLKTTAVRGPTKPKTSKNMSRTPLEIAVRMGILDSPSRGVPAAQRWRTWTDIRKRALPGFHPDRNCTDDIVEQGFP